MDNAESKTMRNWRETREAADEAKHRYQYLAAVAKGADFARYCITQKEEERVNHLVSVLGAEAKAAFIKEVVGTRFVNALEQARLKAGLPEAEVARRMGVSRSKVSRMTATYDDNLTWGDIRAYAEAVGLSISVLFDTADDTATKIKHCVFEIGRMLSHLAELAKESKEDPAIIEGINRFHREVLFNMLIRIDASYRDLPRLQTHPIKDSAPKPVVGTFKRKKGQTKTHA